MTNGYSVKLITAENDCMLRMIDDYMMITDNRELSENRFYRAIETKLNRENKSLENYGYKVPINMDTPLQIERLKWKMDEQSAELQRLLTEEPFGNNIEQQNLYNTIQSDILTYSRDRTLLTDHKFYFIDGDAGVGKSSVMRKLQAYARSIGVLIGICAATTLAALNFKGGIFKNKNISIIKYDIILNFIGQTAHSYFGYPVIEENDKDPEKPFECNVENTNRAELLQNVLVIFWDEFISNHRDIFEAVLKIFNGTVKYIFVTAGDFQQIPPVIKNGAKAEVINALISSSMYWPEFNIIKLIQNMRLLSLTDDVERQNQVQYAICLQNIARNIISVDTVHISDIDDDTVQLGLPNMEYFMEDNVYEAIDWLYPNHMFNSCIACDTVILAATNEIVDIWNEKIQNLNNSIAIELVSKDTFCEVDDPHGHLSNMVNKNVLQKYDVNGCPPHILTLKVGDVCIVLRAMMGLNIPTNSRVLILEINNYVIKAKMLENNKIVAIPRIPFIIQMPFGMSYKILRRQFPLRLAYAMTYNKSQSQTLQKVLLDVICPPFMHGHLYVAMSRVRNAKNIKLFLKTENIVKHEDRDIPAITNVVYQEILL